MAHNRVPGDELVLTHELLSLMLGVRRPGITDAMHSLESSRLIQCARGMIIVLHRKAIEKVAGEYYERTENRVPAADALN